MKNLLIILILLLFGGNGFGQDDEYVRPNSELLDPQIKHSEQLSEKKTETIDSVKFTKGFVFNVGVYRSFDEFKLNSPSLTLLKGVRSSEDLNIDTNTIYYQDKSRLERMLKKRNVWGYCLNGKVYVFVSKLLGYVKKLDESGYGEFDFSKRKIFLEIKSFGMIMVTEAIQKNGYNQTMPGGVNQQDVTEYYLPNATEDPIIINYSNGKMYKNTVENFSQILLMDEQLHSEYLSIKPIKKQKQMMFLFRKKLNERYPIYFYKSK